MRTRIVAAILAACPTTASGCPRVLLPWSGTTRLRSIAQAVTASSCERVAVVLGSAAASIASAVDGLPVATLPNVLWSEGVAASIRCAVAWALRSGADGLLLVHGEQARVDRAHVESLLHAFRTGRTPVASRVGGDVGLPAIFGVELFARLGQLTGDRDARELLRLLPAVNEIPWPEGAIERAIDDAIDSELASALDAIVTPAAIPKVHESEAVAAPICPT